MERKTEEHKWATKPPRLSGTLEDLSSEAQTANVQSLRDRFVALTESIHSVHNKDWKTA